MSRITLHMLDGRRESRFDDIVGLVAADSSGQFGILPGHEALVTVLDAGLIRCRHADDRIRFLACAGGVLVCRDNAVRIVSSRFLAGDHAEELTSQLDALLGLEKAEQEADRRSRTQVERALLRRLREWSELKST